MTRFHRLISARIGFSMALKTLASLALTSELLSSHAAEAFNLPADPSASGLGAHPILCQPSPRHVLAAA